MSAHFGKGGEAYAGAPDALYPYILTKNQKNYSIFITILGIVSLGFLVYLYILLSDNLAGRGAFGVSAQIGTGFYISGIGAFIILIGAALMAQKKKK